METNFISIVIFLTVFSFDFTLSSDNEDYSQMKKLVQNVDKALKSLIKERLIDYSKVHKLNRRSVPEFRNVLIEAQNKLNEKLLKGQRRIKKFKIQRRSDDSNEMNDNSNADQSPLQLSESVQHQNTMIPVYRETMSGYPAMTEFNGKSPLNIFFRDVITNDNRLKRDEDLEDMRNTAEEYEEPIPIKGNLNKPEYTSTQKPATNSPNDDQSSNYPRLSEFSHTIKHDGRGYHTSYFFPNIDKITTHHNKQKDLNSKSNEFWKSETDPKAVRNPVKYDNSVHRTVHEHKPIRPIAPTRPVQQIKYSPQISQNGYNAHSYYPFEQPHIRPQAVIYGSPVPSQLHANLILNRKPLFQNVQYRPRQHSSPMRDNHQNNGQNKRQPILDTKESHQSTQKPTTNPPVHWTKVVAELNEQKSRVSDGWRPKSRQTPARQQSRDSNDNKYFKVGTSVDMN